MHRKVERLFAERWRDTSSWPVPADSEVPKTRRETYERRKRVIEQYMLGAPLKLLCEIEGVDTASVYRMLESCAAVAPDGKICGFRALIPYLRKKAYVRYQSPNVNALAAGRGAGGLFMQLLDNNKALRTFLMNQAARYAQPTFTGRINVKKEHDKFLGKVAELQGTTCYPFGLQSKGREGFRKALNREIASQRGEARGPMRSSVERAFRPQTDSRFRQVQIDAHRLDSFMRVKFVGRKGRFKTRALRPWLIAAIEVDSGACLGWSLSVEREPSHLDLLRCFNSMMRPWVRRQQFEIVGLDYRPGAGMPSGLISRCAGRYADSISLDNALCGHADNIRRVALERLHATLRLGLPSEPRTRSEIEQLFNTLTHRNVQLLVTGVRPSLPNKERLSAIKVAEEHGLTIEQMEEYLDVIICNYNAEPHSAHYGKSPIQFLREEPESALVRADTSPGASWRNLLKIELTVTVSSSEDRAPRITYLKGLYTNDLLRSSDVLAGRKIIITVDLSDLRTVEARVPGGIDLGTLYVRGPWAHFVHDIRLRKKLNGEIADGNFHWAEGVDPEEQVNGFLARIGRAQHSQPSESLGTAERPNKELVPRPRSATSPPRLVADVAKGEELDLDALLGKKLRG